MSLSTYITQENVRFDSTLTNAVVIDSTTVSKTLIETDNLSVADQAALEAFMSSTAAMPRPAQVSINFKSTDGTHPTGLNARSATAGTATFTYKTAITSTTSTKIPVGTGVPGKGRVHSYTAIVFVDGVQYRINTIGANVQTFGALVSVIAPMIGTATIAIVNGAVVITSGTTGSTSSINVQDTGMLFGSAAGETGVNYVTGLSPVSYIANISIDGVVHHAKIDGSSAQTYTQLASQLSTAVGVPVSFVSGVIVISSAKSVVIQDVSLFHNVSGFTGTVALKPYNTRLAAFTTQEGNGAFADRFNTKVVGLTPPVGSVPGKAKLPKTKQFMYYGGIPAAWRFLKDDSTTTPALTPAPTPAP